MKRQRSDDWEWVLQEATATNLRVIANDTIRATFPKSWSRRKIVERFVLWKSIIVDRGNFTELVEQFREETAEKRRVNGQRAHELGQAKIAEQQDNKLVWKTVEAELLKQPSITLKIIPVGFYTEYHNTSGPGSFVVKHFQDSKARFVKAKVTNGFLTPIPIKKPAYVSGFWTDLQFGVQTEGNVTFEYLPRPGVLHFAQGKLYGGMALNMRFDTRQDYGNPVMWKSRDYRFVHELPGAVVTWHAKWWLVEMILDKAIGVAELIQLIGAFYVEERLVR